MWCKFAKVDKMSCNLKDGNLVSTHVVIARDSAEQVNRGTAVP